MAQEGKTTFAFTKLLASADRLFVLDPVRSRPFNAKAEDAEAGMRPADVRVFRSYDEVAAFLLSGEARGKWRIMLRSENEDDYVRAIRYARHYRHVTLLVDEALVFTDNDEALEPLIKASRMGAHFGGGTGLTMWITAQRPMDLPRDIRSQLTQCYSYRQTEPGDLDFLAKKFSPEFAAAVAGLAPHHVVMFPPDQKAAREGRQGELEALDRGRRGGARDPVGREQEPRLGVPQADRRLSAEETDETHTLAAHGS